MAFQCTTLNGVNVYGITTSKLTPSFGNSKTDQAFRRRVELLQDFGFNTASQRVKLSRDGHYVAATGTYPPMVKMYDTRELSMKFERHMDAEVVDFVMLGDDYSKMAFLQADRHLELHAGYGTHFKVRVPRFGRSLAYCRPVAELYVVGDGSEVYRLSLEDGQFKAPFQTDLAAINAVDIAGPTQLVVVGGEGPGFEVWDPRSRKSAAAVDVPTPRSGADCEVSAVQFDETGLVLGVGTTDGRCLVYDVRSAKPLQVKRHQYGLPVHTVRFHSGPVTGSSASSATSKLVMSADSKVIKLWMKDTGKVFTNIEPPSAIHDVRPTFVHKPSADVLAAATPPSAPDSGLIFVAGEQARLMQYYVPDLGVAPTWCSFLDSITEEVEEARATDTGTGTVYEDYKFVTREELTRLGLGHLIGSALLKPYMHGFFMDMKLYSQVHAAADPFALEKYRKEQVRKRVEAKRGNRINIPRRLPTVNADLAQKLMADKKEDDKRKRRKNKRRKNKAGEGVEVLSSSDSEDEVEEEEEGEYDEVEEGGAAGGAGAGAGAGAGLVDDRFAKLFSDPDFQIEALEERGVRR